MKQHENWLYRLTVFVLGLMSVGGAQVMDVGTLVAVGSEFSGWLGLLGALLMIGGSRVLVGSFVPTPLAEHQQEAIKQEVGQEGLSLQTEQTEPLFDEDEVDEEEWDLYDLPVPESAKPQPQTPPSPVMRDRPKTQPRPSPTPVAKPEPEPEPLQFEEDPLPRSEKAIRLEINEIRVEIRELERDRTYLNM